MGGEGDKKALIEGVGVGIGGREMISRSSLPVIVGYRVAGMCSLYVFHSAALRSCACFF